MRDQHKHPDARPSRWHVETRTGIVPLDAQFGIHPPKCVPDALREALFGQPAASQDELAAVDHDPSRLAPMHSYAVLDAAKVQALPERLETSGLAHRCLLAHDADQRLKQAGPWLVALTTDSSFTRNLFTRGETHWTLWDAEPGIYLRSRCPLDALWPKLRALMCVQDEDAKRYILRFWEPNWTRALLQEQRRELIAGQLAEVVHWIVPHADGRVELIGMRHRAPTPEQDQ